MQLPALEPYGWWLVAGFILAAAEMVAPGVFLIWLGVAAVLTGLVTLAFDPPAARQFALFSATAMVAIYGGRRWLTDHPIATDDPMLNDRIARMVGRNVTVAEPIIGGEGRVKVDDGIWPAIGPDSPRGARVTIVGAEGGRLRVEAAES